MFVQINPWDGKNLGRESVRKQVEGCLSRLQVSKNFYHHIEATFDHEIKP